MNLPKAVSNTSREPLGGSPSKDGRGLSNTNFLMAAVHEEIGSIDTGEQM